LDCSVIRYAHQLAKEQGVYFDTVVGFITMFLGLNLLFNVLRIFAAVLPFLGDIVGFIIAATLSIITIAIAWIFVQFWG